MVPIALTFGAHSALLILMGTIWTRILLSAAVLAVLTQNVFVVRTNRRMREAMDRQARETINVGDPVPQLGGVDLTGRRILVSVKGTPTMVFSMSATCQFCNSSLTYWRRLANEAALKGLGVVFVSKDSQPDMAISFGLEKDRLPGTVISDPTFQTYMLLRMATVPSTVLIDSAGNVTAAWLGAIDQQREEEIGRMITKIG